MGWECVQVGRVFAVVTQGTGLGFAGPFYCDVGAGQQ